MTPARDETGAPLIAARERGPGPGRYKLPNTVGQRNHDPTKYRCPSYSFGMRLHDTMIRNDGSPGPGYMVQSNITKSGHDGTPAYSILGRQKELNMFKTPSPGTYSPEKVHPQGERHAPSYSMAARTRYRRRDNVPAPNRYTLPSLLGPNVPNMHSSPCYRMTGRSKAGSFAEDLARTPGPGRYNRVSPNVNSKKAPAYSILGRNHLPDDSTIKPGPGAHSPEKVMVHLAQVPKFSMGIRHSEYITPLIVDIRE